MTTPYYPQGCAAGSEVRRLAPAPAGYAWNVNLNNGNSNRNNQDNHSHVRAVRAGECQGAASFHALYSAWREARRGKKPSTDQLDFDSSWTDRLLELQERLNSCTWTPSPPTCFIATAPKAREIHAPAFSDRVVHHYLVPKLEAIYERTFIHDSYSNRIGKGTHSAVRRLKSFVRQVSSGQGNGHYLQLDIKNFFNSIHRPTLYTLLKPRMERAGLPEHIRRAVHALLNHPIARTGVQWACTDIERSIVPPHKRLENAAPGCGLAIGNLSSQFFANVYLDRLDQFVKHTLKAQRYLRYVDDFVIVHKDPEQLEEWRKQIEAFLRTELRLELKSDQQLAPLHQGIDFLGYVVFPSHTAVRRRVVASAREKLYEWRRSRGTFEQLQSFWSSYVGHFAHANSRRLMADFVRRFPWLARSAQ
ncbi:MAG: reverse transcriptase [Patescibacteria group bacterium]|nr:reverse transcriptase [Patescibacteria group bacterium]